MNTLITIFFILKNRPKKKTVTIGCVNNTNNDWALNTQLNKNYNITTRMYRQPSKVMMIGAIVRRADRMRVGNTTRLLKKFCILKILHAGFIRSTI